MRGSSGESGLQAHPLKFYFFEAAAARPCRSGDEPAGRRRYSVCCLAYPPYSTQSKLRVTAFFQDLKSDWRVVSSIPGFQVWSTAQLARRCSMPE